MKDYRDLMWWASSTFPQIDLQVIKVDARVLFVFIPAAGYMHINTLYLALCGIAVFVFLGYLGYPVPVAIKLFKAKFAGKKRSINTNRRRRRRFYNG